MRFLIVGDLHGQTPKLHVKEFDAIIAPGDFCSDKAKKFQFQSLRERLDGTKNPREWYEIIGKRHAKRLILDSVADGRKVLQRIAAHQVPTYIVPGNWDWTGREHKSTWAVTATNYYPLLFDGLRNVHDAYHQLIELEDVSIIGTGISAGPELPQTAKERSAISLVEYRRRKTAFDREYALLSKLFENATKRKNPVIFLTHNVPYNTPLDKIENEQSPRNGEHFGSVIAKKLVEEYQPLVCIGGHMHEHFGKCMIGKTTVINAGFGAEKNVLLDVKDGKIVNLKFYE